MEDSLSSDSADRASSQAPSRRRLRDAIDELVLASPARTAMLGFALVAAIVTTLLALPVAARGPGSASFADSVLVAVSAVCVTGLTPVVTEQQWSSFGFGVITVAIQVGGIGILTAASLLGMAMSKRLGVRQRLLAAQATGTSQLGQVGSLLRVVMLTMIVAEVVVAALLLPASCSAERGSGRPCGMPCSTPCPPSTTRASQCTREGWSTSSTIRGSSA